MNGIQEVGSSILPSSTRRYGDFSEVPFFCFCSRRDLFTPAFLRRVFAGHAVPMRRACGLQRDAADATVDAAGSRDVSRKGGSGRNAGVTVCGEWMPLAASSLRIREHTPDAPGEGCAGMGTQADAAYRVPRCALIRQPHLAALEPERIRIQGTGELGPTARRGACLSARRRPVRSCGRNGRARPRGGPGRPAAGAHRAVAVRCPRAARVQCSGPGRVVRNAA